MSSKAADFSLLSEMQHNIERNMARVGSTPEIIIAAAPPSGAQVKKELRVGRILANSRHPFHSSVRSMYSRLQESCSVALCNKSFGEKQATLVDAAPGLPRQYSVLEAHMGTIQREPATLQAVSTREVLGRWTRRLRRLRRNAEQACQQILELYIADPDLVAERQALVVELQCYFVAEASSPLTFTSSCTLTKSHLHALRQCVKAGRPLYARRAERLLEAAESLFPPERSVAQAYEQTWRALNKVVQTSEATSLQVALKADAEMENHLQYGESEYLVAVLSAWSLLHSRGSGKQQRNTVPDVN
jgi:hypothetical protein